MAIRGAFGAAPAVFQVRAQICLVSDPKADAKADKGGAEGIASSLSSVAGKVLDQLSLSAWLPSAMLVGNLAVVVQVRARDHPSIAGAIVDLTKAPLGILVALVFALVLATTITQAFEYQVVRTLEGYWGLHLASVPFTWLGMLRHTRSHRVLNEKSEKLTRRACRKAHTALADATDFDDRTVAILDKWSRGRPLTEYTGAEVVAALGANWMQHVPLYLSRRLKAIEERKADLPAQRRIMPTRLGNTLRVMEDTLPVTSDRAMRTYAIDQWGAMPSPTRLLFKQYRTRLDMYCVLVFIFVVLAAVSSLILAADGLTQFEVGFGISYLLLALVSYRAAVFSAKGVNDILGSVRDKTATHEVI